MIGRRGVRLLSAAALAALLGSLGSGIAAPAGPAAAIPRAQDGLSPVSVALTAMTPRQPGPLDTLTISGEVTNTSTSPVARVAVRLRLSPTPVRSRSELTEIQLGTAGRTGIAVDSTRTDVVESLEPGQSAAFTVSVPMPDLDLPDTEAHVLVLGIESLGDVADDGLGTIQTGLTRTFLTWFPEGAAVAPTHVVWLFPLTSAPSRAGNGLFLDDHLATEIGPSGRLSRILDAADAAPEAITWVIDPALLSSLLAMANGYSIRTPTGATVPGEGVLPAAAWLDRLRGLTATAEVTASYYGDPDVVALHRAALDVDIARASTTANLVPSRTLNQKVSGGLVWPAGGRIDEGTLDVVRASGASVVVLSADTLPAAPAITYPPSGSVDLATGGAPLRAAAFDPALSTLVVARDGALSTRATADPIVRQQIALAELAMITLERPSESRTIVIAPSTRWSADPTVAPALLAALAASPWLVPTRLSALMAEPASTIPRSRTEYSPADLESELPAAYLDEVRRMRAQLAALQSVAPDSATASTGELGVALTRAESSAWREEIAVGRRVVTSVGTQIAGQASLVRILSHAPVTLPGDSGVIPITVANDLSRPARVGVRLVGTPRVRFESADIPAVLLAPGQKITLEVAARVIGTGPVAVDIQLLTPEGASFGEPVRTEVRSAAYARAAQWVVGGLFGILVVLIGINFVRRRSVRRDDNHPEGTAGEVHGDG